MIPLLYRAAGFTAVSVAALGAAWWHGYQSGATSSDLKLTQARAQWAQAAASATEAYRAEETRRTNITQEITRNAQLARLHVDADSAAADAARQRLLDAYRTASRRPATSNPDSTDRGTSAPAADDVRSDVFGGVDEVAGSLAAALDRATIAGHACEQWADALKVTP